MEKLDIEKEIKTMLAVLFHFVLRKKGKPMYIKNLIRDSEKLLSCGISYELAISVLSGNEMFAWTGKGMYGLSEWGYPPHVSSIEEAIEWFIFMKGRAVTEQEIYEFFSSKYYVKNSSIIGTLVKKEGIKFERLGRKLWKLKND